LESDRDLGLFGKRLRRVLSLCIAAYHLNPSRRLSQRLHLFFPILPFSH
jgi:hypothetical protein